MTMDWALFGRALGLSAILALMGLGWVGLMGKIAEAVRARLGRSWGVLTLAYVVWALGFVAVVSGALTF